MSWIFKPLGFVFSFYTMICWKVLYTCIHVHMCTKVMKMQISLRTSKTWCELGKQNMLAKKVYSLLFAVKKTSQVVNCSCHVGFSFLHVIGIKRHGGIWVSYCQVWKKFQCYSDRLLQIGNLQEMCQRLTIVKSSIKSWTMLAYCIWFTRCWFWGNVTW